MGLFGLGKKKEKTLEDLAGEFGITLVGDSPDGNYEKVLVKGADESEGIAKIRLLENVRAKGARLLSSNLLYSHHESFGKKLYIVASVAYLSKAS